ncbi:MAG: phospholipase C [Solirubrobacteraceae bacterium]
MDAARPDLPSGALTRRALLGAAAGGAAAVGLGRIPAWARPLGRAAELAQAAGVRRPDSRPFPHLPAGHASMPQIEHIVVLIMENHSFDNLLGMVPARVPGRRAVDGFALRHGRPANWNPDAGGHRVLASPASSPCQLPAEPMQTWNASHASFDGGRNDGFVRASGAIAMRYWDEHDLPFTYSLVRHFPIGQRYFCSTMAQTYPNLRYFFCGTSSGLVVTDLHQSAQLPAANGTIFDRLDAHRISWKVYYEDAFSPAIVPGFYTQSRAPRIKTIPSFYADAAAGRLPHFTYLCPNFGTTSEENPQDIQLGERFIAKIVHALMHAPTWSGTALFVTWDEHGGYYDHVPPPRAINPDSIAPIEGPNGPPLVPGAFDRYGFRVPLLAVSPWARASYVSKVVQDHTSLTAFIEHKWNLPAMTFRDANAHPMTDYFDFSSPAFRHPPALAPMPGLAHGLAQCRAAGLTPPLKGAPGTFSD